MKEIYNILEGIYNNIELRRTIVPLFIGDPGVSKSVQIRQFAKDKGVKLIPFVTSQRNPFEISGLAMPNRKTERMEFWDFDTLLDMKDGDILFFDEVFNGNPTVLNACLTILEEREMISGKKLPDIMIVAAANPQGMVPLTPQIKERFVWYKFEFPKDGWKKHMLTKYKMPDVVSNKLCVLINNEEFKNPNNYHSARSIDKAISMIVNNVHTPYEDELLPILNTLIENKLKEEVKLSEDRVLAVGESISWLDMVRLNNNIVLPEDEDKDLYSVILEKVGSTKLQLIKTIKELTGFGLKECKDLADNFPSEIKTNLTRDEAYEFKSKLENAGATILVKENKSKGKLDNGEFEILMLNDKDEVIGKIKDIKALKTMYYFSDRDIEDINNGIKKQPPRLLHPPHSFISKKII